MYDINSFLSEWGLTTSLTEIEIELILQIDKQTRVMFNTELKQIYESVLKKPYQIVVYNCCPQKVTKKIKELINHG